VAALDVDRDAPQRVDRGGALTVLALKVARLYDYAVKGARPRGGDCDFLRAHDSAV
jgi:hypothetical protein